MVFEILGFKKVFANIQGARWTQMDFSLKSLIYMYIYEGVHFQDGQVQLYIWGLYPHIGHIDQWLTYYMNTANITLLSLFSSSHRLNKFTVTKFTVSILG